MSHLREEGDAFSRSIANALEAFRKGVDGELRKKDELIQHLQTNNDDLQRKNDEFQQANTSLQAELATIKEQRASSIESGTHVPNLLNERNIDEDNAPPIPYKDYAKLVRDFNMLSQNTRVVEKARLKYQDMYRDMKNYALRWKEQAMKFERDIKIASALDRPPLRADALLASFSSSRSSTPDSAKSSKLSALGETRRSLPCVEKLPTPGLEKDQARPKSPNQGVLQAGEEPGRLTPKASKSVAGLKSAAPSSSQTTESELGTQFPSDDLAHIPSSPPVIVSEKVLKRKRGLATPSPFVVGYVGEGTPAKPIKIKSEPHSSPQEPTTARKLNRVETLDLDEMDNRIDTPRKRRRIRELQRQASSFKTSSLNVSNYQRSTSLPAVVKDEPINRITCATESEGEIMHPDISGKTTPLTDDRALSEPTIPRILHLEDVHDTMPSQSKDAKVLQPISANQRILPRTSDVHDKLWRQEVDRGAKALDTVAEDGNFPSTIAKSNSPHGSFDADDVLDHLLEEPAPSRKQLRSPAATSHSKIRVTPEIPSPDSRQGMRGNKPDIGLFRDSPKIKQLATSRAKNPSKPMPGAIFETPSRFVQRGSNLRETSDTPSRSKPNLPPKSKTSTSRVSLRSKPMDALNIDDFKLNPKAKGGLDMAYADPVRGREARRHLDGCSDPNCAHCGDQLQALAAELDVTVGSALFASTQDEDLTEEEKLLKFYLGDTFDRELAKSIKPETRTRMILQAKTKLLAERHARHRVKPMGRAKSPPGFWDYDMPTTQELDAQREEADKRQKELIAERYHEAMRPGGRWIFRDE